MTRRAMAVWTCAPVAFLLLAAATGTVSASQGLTGALGTERTILVGATTIDSAPSRAVFVNANTQDLEAIGSWKLMAEDVTVHWSHRSWVGFGSTPKDPQSSVLELEHPDRGQGERRFHEAEVAGAYNHEHAALLVLAKNVDGALTGKTEPLAQIRPSAGEAWISGYLEPSTIQAGSRPLDDLSARFDVPLGTPLFETESPSRWTLVGDLVLYLWQANVTITEKGGATQTHSSGLTYGNETQLPGGAGIASRQATAQFLHVRAANATLEIIHERGSLHSSQGSVPVVLAGMCRFEEATGYLEGADSLYEARSEPVELAGTTRLVAQTAQEPRRIEVQVEFDGTSTNLGASWIRDPPRGSWWTLTTGGVLVAMLAAGGVGSYYVWPGYRARLDPQREMDTARDELDRNRPGPAARRLRRVLRFHGTDGTAWFLYVVARSNLDGPMAVAPHLERIWNGISPRLPIALTLATEFMRHSDEARARTWYERALQEPEAKDFLASDPQLRKLTERLTPAGAPHYSYG